MENAPVACLSLSVSLFFDNFANFCSLFRVGWGVGYRFCFFLSNVRVWYFGFNCGVSCGRSFGKDVHALGTRDGPRVSASHFRLHSNDNNNNRKKRRGRDRWKRKCKKTGWGKGEGGGGEKNGRHIGLISLAPTITICIKEKRLNIWLFLFFFV